jgi:hypothetical protein
MEIGESRSDYKEINLRLFTTTNGNPAHQTCMARDGRRLVLLDFLGERLDGFHRA